MNVTPYQKLAKRLDALPNGFPATQDGAELHLLEKLFTPEEAALAAELRITLETPKEIASRFQKSGLGEFDFRDLKTQLKGMAKKGLINAGRAEGGLGYGLLPFVVGIYEMQIGRIDKELAQLFETYYQQAFRQMLKVQPEFHRVVPIGESIEMDLEVQPFESASEIINSAQAWGVTDCICRLQKSLIGDPCEHPLDVCMILSQRPGVFDRSSVITPLTREQAHATLRRAADAGLVHSVSNSREELSYICNCCTCSCGILRGMAEMGIANVVARSPFINQVDERLCIGCEDCQAYCQFEALKIFDGFMVVDDIRCVGCGICVRACPERAMTLVRRPADETLPIPASEREWQTKRAKARGVDILDVL